MPDVSMCGDSRCPSRERCYRSPYSGTRPTSRAQTWFSFGRPAAADRCAEFWPVTERAEAGQ